LKIVILCAYFQPEFGYREYYYSKNLAKLGHEVHVITSDRILRISGWENIAKSAGYVTGFHRGTGVFELDGFTMHRHPTIFEYERLIFLRGISNTLRSIKPDIVHIIENGFAYSIPVMIHKQDIGYKVIYEIEISLSQTHLLKRIEYLQYYLIKKPLLEYMISRADMLNICTDQVELFLRKNIKASGGKIHRMVLGADPDIFYTNTDERFEIRSMLKISDDQVLFVTASKIEPQKRFDMLIRAIGTVKRENPNVRLLIVGSGNESVIDELREITKSENLEDTIIFYPFVKRTELRKFYNAADIGIWTQATITSLEAMACGLPIIVPNDEATHHLVEDGNGQSYEYQNWDQLVECLRYYMLLENRIESSKKAKIAFNAKYDYLTLTKKLVDNVYLPVLNNS